MSYSYGWSYASQSRPAVRRRGKKNQYCVERRKTKKLHRDAVSDSTRPFSLGRTGRMVVAVILVLLSLVVMGKEAALKASVEQAMLNGWAAVQHALGWEKKEEALPVPLTTDVQEDVTMATTATLEPKALLLDRNLFALNKDGSVWSLPNDQQPKDLPVITGLVVREEPDRMGMRLQVDYNERLLDAILKTPYIGQISEIHLGSSEGVILYMRDGIKVMLQNGSELDRDLKRLGAVIGDIRVKEKRIALVDLRYSQHVVVRPKGGR